jgi:hypothetical protein
MIAKVKVIFQISKIVEVDFNPDEHESPCDAFDEYGRDDCELYNKDGHPELINFNHEIVPLLKDDKWDIDLWDTEEVFQPGGQ